MSKNIDIAYDIIKKMMDKGLLTSVEQPPEGKTTNEANIELVCKAIEDISDAIKKKDTEEELNIAVTHPPGAVEWLQSPKE